MILSSTYLLRQKKNNFSKFLEAFRKQLNEPYIALIFFYSMLKCEKSLHQ